MTGIAYIDIETGELVLHHPKEYGDDSVNEAVIEGQRCFPYLFGSAQARSYEWLWKMLGESVIAEAPKWAANYRAYRAGKGESS